MLMFFNTAKLHPRISDIGMIGCSYWLTKFTYKKSQYWFTTCTNKKNDYISHNMADTTLCTATYVGMVV